MGYYTENFGAEPDSSADSMMGDIPTFVTVWQEATVNGEDMAIANVSLVRGLAACDIQWFGAPGPFDPQDTTFSTFLGTFALD